jgi:hypothetical protein
MKTTPELIVSLSSDLVILDVGVTLYTLCLAIDISSTDTQHPLLHVKLLGGQMDVNHITTVLKSVVCCASE